MMAYTLRHSEELRDSREYFATIPTLKSQAIDKKQLSMATQLIEAYSRPLHLRLCAVEKALSRDPWEAMLRNEQKLSLS
jgi:non-homologous end joining protein Ku